MYRTRDIDEMKLFGIRLAIKYIRHLQLLLASPPGSTVDYEATNFSLDPLPSWRSFGFSAPSTSKELNYDLPLGVFMPPSGSTETPIPEFVLIRAEILVLSRVLVSTNIS